MSDAMTAAPSSFLQRHVTVILAGLGLALCAFVMASPWIIRTYDFVVFVPMMGASGLLTLLATRIAHDVPSSHGLAIIFIAAAIMRLFLLTEPPHLSTDVYRYVWDGRVQNAGINPYRYMPADSALVSLRDTAVYPNINRADYAVTAYPPVAQMFFAAVTKISDGIVAMRAALILCELIVIGAMLRLLRETGRPATAVVAWAWHPLAVWEIANSGHIDGLMTALLMLGVWLLVAHRALAGVVAIALAALAKPYAIVVTPAFWRPWDWRLPVAAIATLVLCYLPYLGVGRGVFGFLTTGYLVEEGFESGAGYWIVGLINALLGPVPGLKTIYFAIALVVLAAFALRVGFRSERPVQQTLNDICALLLLGLFVVSPNYPWYFLGIVPFVVLGGGTAAWTLSLTAIFLYRPAILPAHELTWKTIAFLPFVCVLAWQYWRSRSKGSVA